MFVTNSQQQQSQQSTLLGLTQTVTQTPTVQTNKTITTVLPSLTPQQINQFQTQQPQQQIHIQPQNNVQSYNTTPMRVCHHLLIIFETFYLSFRHKLWIKHKLII